jgi:hypothetical protein
MTPFELAFGATEFEARIFPSLEREAAEHGIDPARRDRFAFLTVGEDALREWVPVDATPEMLEQFRALFFHGFNFWRAGAPLYLMEPAVARFLVEAAPDLEDWELALPHPSIYLQLPRNLFWASVAPDATPEPVDGLFATQLRDEDPLGPAFRHLEVLLVLGVRRDRAGFSVIPFDTEVGPGIARVWAEAPGRDERREFNSVLPGGDISGLYSILTTTEALKLLARALWFAEQHPEGVVREDPPGVVEQRPGPLASRLPWHRLTLGDSKPDAADE